MFLCRCISILKVWHHGMCQQLIQSLSLHCTWLSGYHWSYCFYSLSSLLELSSLWDKGNSWSEFRFSFHVRRDYHLNISTGKTQIYSCLSSCCQTHTLLSDMNWAKLCFRLGKMKTNMEAICGIVPDDVLIHWVVYYVHQHCNGMHRENIRGILLSEVMWSIRSCD